jgi:hypothetical protein
VTTRRDEDPGQHCDVPPLGALADSVDQRRREVGMPGRGRARLVLVSVALAMMPLPVSAWSHAAAPSVGQLEWDQLSPPQSPPGIIWPAAAYDPVRKRVVMFGGNPAMRGWRELTPEVAPTARFGAAMAYDSDRHMAVLFGGDARPLGEPRDTWTLAWP